MFAARDQENVAFHRQNNAAMKQLQKTPGARYPKTPIKVPLNDENAAHAIKGAKSIGGSRIGGNENIMASKASKSQFVTPMHPRSRAVLGDKTTNAKAKGMQSVNVKSAIREIEQTGSRAPATARPRQKQPQAETQKLRVHTERDDPLSEDEPEYCPPRPVDLPYESDVFPDGVLTFNALKPENMFKGYYQHYFNPVDEDGVSLADKRLAESTRKALEEGERRIREDMDSFEWASVKEVQDENAAAKKAQAKSLMPVANPLKRTTARGLALRQVPSNTMARRATGSLSIDDGTKSVQRRAAPPTRQTAIPLKKTGPVIPRFASTKTTTAKPAVSSSRTPLQRRSLEAASRSTIGYNKGRTTASMLNRGPAQPGSVRTRDPVPRSRLAVSRDSDKTITQTRFARSNAASIPARTAVAEDAEWKARVPSLSIFAHDDDDEGVSDEGDDFNLLIGGGASPVHDDLDEDFEIRILE